MIVIWEKSHGIFESLQSSIIQTEHKKGFLEGKNFVFPDISSTSNEIKEKKKENHITISSYESEKSIKEVRVKEE